MITPETLADYMDAHPEKRNKLLGVYKECKEKRRGVSVVQLITKEILMNEAAMKAHDKFMSNTAMIEKRHK